MFPRAGQNEAEGEKKGGEGGKSTDEGKTHGENGEGGVVIELSGDENVEKKLELPEAKDNESEKVITEWEGEKLKEEQQDNASLEKNNEMGNMEQIGEMKKQEEVIGEQQSPAEDEEQPKGMEKVERRREEEGKVGDGGMKEEGIGGNEEMELDRVEGGKNNEEEVNASLEVEVRIEEVGKEQDNENCGWQKKEGRKKKKKK